ncbi:HTTM domain-containing protein [Thalassoglobus sp. JC818]|uniref:HTTM domain-containing protein n=1 Tax=Thalassoglobus sp. JC818 TaxID=3232136 RepID=UPI0034589BA3
MTEAFHNPPNLPSEEKQTSKIPFSEYLFEGVSIDWLIVYRISFGLVMAWFSSKSIEEINYYYVDPLFHFTYDGFEWIAPWDFQTTIGETTVHGMHLVFAAMVVCGVLIAIGFWYRIAATAFAVLFTYIFLCDKCYYQNHYYLVTILSWMMPFLPANRAFSIDALLHPEIRSFAVPRWTLWMLRFEIGVPYFFGGIAKINADWLRGQPMRLNFDSALETGMLSQFLDSETVVQMFVWGGLLFDLLIVPALLWKPTRLLAFLLCLGFHLTNAFTWTIGIFPWLMILATTVYFEPDWPTRVVSRLTGIRHRPSTDLVTFSMSRFSKQLTTACLIAFVAFQSLMPFRHFLFQRDPNWDEYGHHFSWHMLLRAKQQALAVYATDPATGRTGMIDLKDFVTIRQLAVVSRDPRLIHQLCHHIQDELAAIGYRDLEIRTIALVSLNGRKPQLMIDPNVDLAAVPLSWKYPSWVVPLKEPFRHDAWEVPVNRWLNVVEFSPPLPDAVAEVALKQNSPPKNPVDGQPQASDDT